MKPRTPAILAASALLALGAAACGSDSGGSAAATGKAAASAEPSAGRLNATYQRSALPAAKKPEQWSAGEHRALAAAGVTAFAREVHTEPVKQPRPRPKTKAQSKS